MFDFEELLSHLVGIGLYLQDVARYLPEKQDFHEPYRTIQELSPYDHLRRFLTLCTTHLYRNIRKCPVTEAVRNTMRSLICVQHQDWEGALHTICVDGAKAGQNWLSDKETSKFAFAAMCWEKSWIPLEIWQARRRESNVVEVVHANVNLEGTNCTLLGGRALQDRENFGIRETYQSKHPYENAMKNIRRKAFAQQKDKRFYDARIESHNVKLIELQARSKRAQDRVQHAFEAVHPHSSSHTFEPSAQVLRAYENAKKAADKVKAALEKQVKQGETLAGKGSGRVNLLLPEQSAHKSGFESNDKGFMWKIT
ncbi:hypothetical protein F5878DRAFT_647702 [Lentinula raphanica]|uniref:Uncharacterized protein n=1 Tax=Lentinula raphanica TaxID=153919 RepID=A0AA38NVF6_9AGAR|nr:hypothetical protein F5878DRAFT_647702 [Lentinula raphanica]